MSNRLLMSAALVAGLLVVFAFFAGQHATSVSDKRICARVNKLDDVIVALLVRSQKTLPTQPFYKQHPEALPAARKLNARALREFRGAAC